MVSFLTEPFSWRVAQIAFGKQVWLKTRVILDVAENCLGAVLKLRVLHDAQRHCPVTVYLHNLFGSENAHRLATGVEVLFFERLFAVPVRLLWERGWRPEDTGVGPR